MNGSVTLPVSGDTRCDVQAWFLAMAGSWGPDSVKVRCLMRAVRYGVSAGEKIGPFSRVWMMELRFSRAILCICTQDHEVWCVSVCGSQLNDAHMQISRARCSKTSPFL